MIFLTFLLIACSASISYGNYPLDPEEMVAVQERLEKYEMLEEILRSVFLPEEAREDKKECLPEGAECHFASGPNCCGIETRCVVWDTQLPTTKTKSSATWISKCRKYNLGVLMKKIEETFG